MIRLGILILGLLIVTTGCLRTREDLKEVETSKAMRTQVDSLQKVHADSNSRLEDLMDQNRQLNGRIEELEQRLSQTAQAQGSGKEDLQKSLGESKRQSEILQEGILKLENQVQALQEEIVTLKTNKSGSSKTAGNKDDGNKSGAKDSDKGKPKDKEKDLIDVALGDFQEKKWKEAILNFDQYREKYPTGKYAPEATYKTGVSFQELGMNDEAKVFYKEVTEKFPKSDMSKKAQIRLKSLNSSKK